MGSRPNAVKAAFGTSTIRPGGRVIKIRPDKIEQAFPDWKRIKQTDDVRGPEGPLKLYGKNLTTWDGLAPGLDRIRLLQFILPAAKQSRAFDATADGADASFTE